MRTGVILFAHGARDAEWRAPVDSLAARVAAQLPDAEVRCAFLEHMAPTLPDAVSVLASSGSRRLVIVPVFLARGGHLKHDLPRLLEALRADFPGVELRATPPVGEAEPVLAAMAAWVCASACA